MTAAARPHSANANGGVLRLVRADLAPLQSPNGQYHFTVTGFYALNNGGSRAGSRTFFVP